MAVKVITFGYQGVAYQIRRADDQLSIVAIGPNNVRREVVLPPVDLERIGTDPAALAAFCEASFSADHGGSHTESVS